MNKSIILSYASKGREEYFKRQLNLIRSIKQSELDVNTYIVADGGYCDEYMGVKIMLDFPTVAGMTFHRHSEIPYQFKLAMIYKAIEMGYEKIFWADSIFHFVKGKDIVRLLDQQESGVMCFHNLGHELKKYISDKAVLNLGITESSLELIPQCFGGFWGFDVTKTLPNKILKEMYEQSNLGSFNDGGSDREGFVAHRHEQAVLSVLLWKYNIDLLPYGTIVYSPHHLPPYEYGSEFYGHFS